MKTNIPKWLVVHHTGGTDQDFYADTSHHTFRIVNDWHRQNPYVWLGELSSLDCAIGYHYFIDKAGKLTQGRADTDEGAHCKGMNTSSIGICLAGNFSRFKENRLPTFEQIKTLKNLLIELMRKHDIPLKRIVPHRFFNRKDCYGKNLPDDWAREVADKETLKYNGKQLKIKLLKKQINILEKLIKLYVQILALFSKGRSD